MSYGPRARDRYRMVVATLTGVTTVGAISSTGLITGVAAAEHADTLAEQAEHARAVAQEHAAAQAAYASALAAFEAANAVEPQPLAATAPIIAPKQRPAEERVATPYVAEYLAQSAPTTVGSGGSVRSGKSEQRSGGGNEAGSSSGSGGSDSGGQASAPPPQPPPPPPPPSSGS